MDCTIGQSCTSLAGVCLKEHAWEPQPQLDSCTLFCKGLGKTVTESQLYTIFSAFGRLASVQIARHRSGRCAGFAVIQFVRHEDAKAAMLVMDAATLAGRRLNVRWYTSDMQNSTSGSLCGSVLGHMPDQHGLHSAFTQQLLVQHLAEALKQLSAPEASTAPRELYGGGAYEDHYLSQVAEPVSLPGWCSQQERSPPTSPLQISDDSSCSGVSSASRNVFNTSSKAGMLNVPDVACFSQSNDGRSELSEPGSNDISGVPLSLSMDLSALIEQVCNSPKTPPTPAISAPARRAPTHTLPAALNMLHGSHNATSRFAPTPAVQPARAFSASADALYLPGGVRTPNILNLSASTPGFQQVMPGQLSAFMLEPQPHTARAVAPPAPRSAPLAMLGTPSHSASHHSPPVSVGRLGSGLPAHLDVQALAALMQQGLHLAH